MFPLAKGEKQVSSHCNGSSSPSRKPAVGEYIRDVGSTLKNKFFRDKPNTVPVAEQSYSLDRHPRGTNDHRDRQNVSHSSRPPVVSDQAVRPACRSRKQGLRQDELKKHSWSRSHSESHREDRLSAGRVNGTTEVLDDVLREQEALRQKCAELKRLLKEKEELNQMLVEQQTKYIACNDDLKESKCNSSACSMSKDVAELQVEVQKLQLTNENFVFELSEKEEEIRSLKNRYDSRQERIKCLEQQKSEVSIQAKQFEIDFHAEREQNKLLQDENERLKHQLATTSLVDNSQNCSVEPDDQQSCPHLSVIASLRAQLKELNEDIATVREHTKEQSRQILIHRQQAEMTQEMEQQLNSMEGKIQELEEEQGKLQERLRVARSESHRLQTERKLLDNELETSKKETIRFSSEKDELKEKHDTVLAEYNQALKNLEGMSDLSFQFVEANKTIKEQEQQLKLYQEQIKQYQDDFREERQDREVAQGLIADLEKECATNRGTSDYSEHNERLRAAEEANQQLLQELDTVRREAAAQHEALHQDMQAKSSQVKQYAKENDRLKKALEEACAKHSSQVPHVNGVNSPLICSQKDIKNVIDENERYREKIHELERMNVELQERQRASTAHTPLTAEATENVSKLSVNHVRRPVRSWPQEDVCGQASETSPTGQRIEADSADLGGQVVNTERNNFDIVEEDGLQRFSRQSSADYENWPIPGEVVVPEEETSAPVHANTVGISTNNDYVHAGQQSDKPQALPVLLTQHHELQSAVSKQSHNDPFQNFKRGGERVASVDASCEAIPLDDFNNAEHSESASNTLEDSTVLFENPLQRELDDEIHHQAAQVIQQVSGNRRESNTDPKRPFDPNLVCPMCRKQFRIGEIQRFRRHVNTCTGTNDD